MRKVELPNGLLGGLSFFWVVAGCLIGPVLVPLPGIVTISIIFAWLALGLLFGIGGLARGNFIGRFFAVLALGLWLLIVWATLLKPVLTRPRSRAFVQPNNFVQATPGCAILLVVSQKPAAPDDNRSASAYVSNPASI